MPENITAVAGTDTGENRTGNVPEVTAETENTPKVRVEREGKAEGDTAGTGTGIVLRPYQQECIDILNHVESGRHLVSLATGLGKCLGRGTPVLMYDGHVVPVETIRDGDSVMGPDGRPRRVCGVTRGMAPMYRITQKTGMSYTANGPHILSLKVAGAEEGDILIAPDGRILHNGDIYNISIENYLKTSWRFRRLLKGWHTGVEFAWKNVAIPPYILGVWLGAGIPGQPKFRTGNFRITDILRKYCADSHYKISTEKPRVSGGVFLCTVENQDGAESRAESFEKNLRKYRLDCGKRIPQCYLTNDRNTRLELLAGLLDTCGMAEGHTVLLRHENRRLAVDLLYLARSLGFAADISEKSAAGAPSYEIRISGNLKAVPVKVIAEKLPDSKTWTDEASLTSIEVKPAGVGEYFGFELKGPDRLFLLGDFTVTHNTVIFSSLERHGRTLILSHRDELVRQPEKYYSCSYGIEKADET